jgi:hypothetical protein
MTDDLDPGQIIELGMGFMRSKTLLSAVELGLFTVLADDAMTGAELCESLGLAPRANPDFFDGLLSMGLLHRDGDGAEARYRNTPQTRLFLDRTEPTYVGGILEMANARLYGFWADLTEGLRTGQPQNEMKTTGESMFGALYADPARLEQFINGMTGASVGNFMALAEKFDFSPYRTMYDVGGSAAILSIMVANRHQHMTCVSADLPEVSAIAAKSIAGYGLSDRVQTADLDFFNEAFPAADVITMGMILHDWDLPTKKMLIAKAYDALPPGGAFIAIESLIDDERRQNTQGLMMSLNMLIEFGVAFDYTGADFAQWCTEAGFQRTEVIPLAGPSSAAIAYK